MLHLDVVDVVLQLSSCQSLGDVVAVLRGTTRDLIKSDGVTVVLRDGDQCYYVEENAIGPLWKGRRFPLSACISGWSMLNRQQVKIEDIYADSRIPHDAYRPTFVKSLVMTPVRASDPVGAIGAYWATHHAATFEELSILQALANSAAMALENTQLIEELRERSRRKDAFMSMLAHELRNPLAPIRNGLHLLRLQGRDAEVVRDASDMMERQVTHLSRLVDDLLDVARINSGKVTLKTSEVDLVTLLRQSVEDYRPAMRNAGISVKLELPLMSVRAEVDATRLAQVFGNLLDNARKYTPSGGQVSVEMQVDSTSHRVRIEISDNGVGISPKLLPRIFESFTQADESLDRAGGGLGLGLSVAHGLLELHGGTINVLSEGVGRGTRVTVELPNVKLAEVVGRGRADGLTEQPGKSVLIIEDNRDVARSLQRLLKAYGYNANVAYDGVEGAEAAQVQRPQVVLCDIGLPRMDGYAVARTLRKSRETAAAHLIAVTGYGSDEDRERARQAGFDAHVVKPVNVCELLGYIQAGRLAVV